MEHKVVTDYTNVNTANEYLKVYVRARPPNNSDKEAEDMFRVGPGVSGESVNKKIMLTVSAQCLTSQWFLLQLYFDESGQLNSTQIKSTQINANQIKSNQIKST